jgi:hypothetical protein
MFGQLSETNLADLSMGSIHDLDEISVYLVNFAKAA